MESSWDGGRLLWESPTVSYHATRLETEFTPTEGEEYFLYRDTGSDDHLLQINAMFAQLTILDDDNTISTSYERLISKGVLDSRRTDDRSFHIRLLLAVIDYLKQDEASDSILHQFMKSNGLSIDGDSLCCMTSLLSSVLDFKLKEKNEEDETDENKTSGPDEQQMRMYSVM
jgi:hypothetical protein